MNWYATRPTPSWFCEPGNRLGPGEAFFDALANGLADGIVRSSWAIDGGGAIGRALRHMGAMLSRKSATKVFVS